MYLSLVVRYDVIIIGGGLAGLTAAIHLRKEGYRILL
ncbi:MAG: FAD-dependent oxidoreductase, partial [Muriicola sp.]